MTEHATCYRIVIVRWRPVRLNVLMRLSPHGRKRALDGDAALVAVNAIGLPKARGKRSVKLRITITPRQHEGDVDAYWKSTLDALVRCGQLVDDTRRYCELEPIEFSRGPKSCTTIELRDIDTEKEQGS